MKWFRERSARNRLREEKEILEEELKRTARSLSYLREIWKTLARRSSALGGVSYAHKQAAMFERLEADCEKLRIKGLEKSAMYKQWYVFYHAFLNELLMIFFIGLLRQLKDPSLHRQCWRRRRFAPQLRTPSLPLLS